MAATAANRDVPYYASAELVDIPMDDNVVIYKGGFVGAAARPAMPAHW